MPLGGSDTRYNLSWEEQDKIRRRLELKKHLKEEGVRKRYSPYLQMKGELLQDPALDRYMDLRKKGRLPNTPMKPSAFYGMLALLIVPVVAAWKISEWETYWYKEGCKTGEVPYKDRLFKSIG